MKNPIVDVKFDLDAEVKLDVVRVKSSVAAYLGQVHTQNVLIP